MGLRDYFKKKEKMPATDVEQDSVPRKQNGRENAPIGGHWGILCNYPDEVQELCMKAAAKGDRIRAAPIEGNNAFGALLQDWPFRLVCVIENIGRILTFYPMSEGKKTSGRLPECNPGYPRCGGGH